MQLQTLMFVAVISSVFGSDSSVWQNEAAQCEKPQYFNQYYTGYQWGDEQPISLTDSTYTNYNVAVTYAQFPGLPNLCQGTCNPTSGFCKAVKDYLESWGSTPLCALNGKGWHTPRTSGTHQNQVVHQAMLDLCFNEPTCWGAQLKYDGQYRFISTTNSDGSSYVEEMTTYDCFWNTFVKGSGASSNGDPHIKFANGVTADFRGSNNDVYNFLSVPGLSLNVRTQESTFKYKNTTVHGTFITEAFFTALTNNNRSVLYSQSSLRANDNNWGWRMSNGTCDNRRFYTFPHHTQYCDNFKVQTDASSSDFNMYGWGISVKTNYVYGHISGCKKRLDIKISGPSNSVSHGIIGQSFNRNIHVTNGKKDVYPKSGEFTTYAQAEGSIQGTHRMYKMETPFSTDFAFSTFHEKQIEDTGKVLTSTVEEQYQHPEVLINV